MLINLLIFNVKFETNTKKPRLQPEPPRGGIEESQQIHLQRKSVAYHIHALKNIMRHVSRKTQSNKRLYKIIEAII